MTSWVCKQDGVPFAPGAPCCPVCRTRDAHEEGGDWSVNVFELDAEAEVAERLGDVDVTYREPVNDTSWQEGVAPDAPDKALPVEDTPDADQDTSTSKAGQKDVSS